MYRLINEVETDDIGKLTNNWDIEFVSEKNL